LTTPSPQPRQGLTLALSGPARAGINLTGLSVRRFHLRLLTVSRFAGRVNGDNI